MPTLRIQVEARPKKAHAHSHAQAVRRIPTVPARQAQIRSHMARLRKLQAQQMQQQRKISAMPSGMGKRTGLMMKARAWMRRRVAMSQSTATATMTMTMVLRTRRVVRPARGGDTQSDNPTNPTPRQYRAMSPAPLLGLRTLHPQFRRDENRNVSVVAEIGGCAPRRATRAGLPIDRCRRPMRPMSPRVFAAVVAAAAEGTMTMQLMKMMTMKQRVQLCQMAAVGCGADTRFACVRFGG